MTSYILISFQVFFKGWTASPLQAGGGRKYHATKRDKIVQNHRHGTESSTTQRRRRQTAPPEKEEPSSTTPENDGEKQHHARARREASPTPKNEAKVTTTSLQLTVLDVVPSFHVSCFSFFFHFFNFSDHFSTCCEVEVFGPTGWPKTFACLNKWISQEKFKYWMLRRTFWRPKTFTTKLRRKQNHENTIKKKKGLTQMTKN